MMTEKVMSSSARSSGAGGRIVALTGNIGSGKSTVARMLAELDATVIDADRLAREVVEPGSTPLRQIVERFGPEVLDAAGYLDRTRLGEVVFRDSEARADLEAITHPAIRTRMAERIQAALEAGSPLVVVEVPLLFETGMDALFPETILVTAPDPVRRHRIRDRDDLTDEEVDRRMAAQMPQSEKERRADHVLVNDGSLDALRQEVDLLNEEIAGPAGAA